MLNFALLLVAGVLSLLSRSSYAAPEFSSIDVFTNGIDGYLKYRIPAIETAPDGSLLAFAEGNVHGVGECGDDGADIDLVARRSTDNGQTWSELRVIDDPGVFWSAGNPATVVDHQTGRVWVFYLLCKPGANTFTARPRTDDAQLLARTSDDNGVTWSERIDLTRVSRDFNDRRWGISVPGPGGAIQLRTGRLVVPVWKNAPFKNFVIYSDDHGTSWHRSQEVPGEEQGNENHLVELVDGRVRMDIRQDDFAPTIPVSRRRSFSSDGGQTWSPYESSDIAINPVSCGMERFTSILDGDNVNRILWTGPRGPGRRDMVIRVSYDEGQTFTNEHLLGAGGAVYSGITILRDRSVGVLWERGTVSYITFSRFNLDYLEGQ